MFHTRVCYKMFHLNLIQFELVSIWMELFFLTMCSPVWLSVIYGLCACVFLVFCHVGLLQFLIIFKRSLLSDLYSVISLFSVIIFMYPVCLPALQLCWLCFRFIFLQLFFFFFFFVLLTSLKIRVRPRWFFKLWIKVEWMNGRMHTVAAIQENNRPLIFIHRNF